MAAQRDHTEYIALQAGRVEICYWPAPGSTADIVMLHEGLGCIAMWRDFPAQLAAATGCGVYAYSRIGYGRSDACTLPRPLSYMHDEANASLPQLLQALDLKHYHLLGHSDGASITLIFAGSKLSVPAPCSVIALAPHVFVEDVSIQSIRLAKDAFRNGDLRHRLERYHGANTDCAFDGWAEAWLDPSFRHWNIEDYLPAIHYPTLVLQGADDPYGTKAQVSAIEDRLGAQCTTQLIPACGHAPHREALAATLNAIATFLETA